KADLQCIWAESGASTFRAVLRMHEGQSLGPQIFALRGGHRMSHIAFGTPEPPLVWLGNAVALRCYLNYRLVLGEQQPLPGFFRQGLERDIDVVAEVRGDIAQVLALPCTGPGGYGPVADAQGRVGNQRLLAD